MAPSARAAALVVLVVAAACAPVASVPPPRPPDPLDAATVEWLAALLRLEDRREFAADALGAAARSPSPRVRARAALALGRIRHPAGLSLLLELAQDPDTAVTATAAFALGQLGDTAAVPALAAMLTEEHALAAPTVAGEAAYALGKLRSAGAREALRRLLDRFPVDEPALAGPAGSALLAVWRHPRTAEADPIARWLRAPDPELRWRAAYALVRRPDPGAVPLLLRLASDADTAIRALAVRGLAAPRVDSAAVARASVLPVLTSSLRDPSYGVRIQAVRSLGTYQDPAAAEPLVPLLATPERHLALAAAEALGSSGPAAAAAVSGLERLVAADSVPVALRQAALEALARVAPDRGEELAVSHAGSREWRLRAGAARALALAAGPSRAVETFLRDADPRVRAAALGAALSAAGDSVRPLRAALLEALGMEDVMVRTAALEGLGRLADPATLPAVLDAYGRALGDPASDAALAALDALAALRRGGVDPARALFARYPRPQDPLLRLRARERFADVADRAWGDPLPVEPGLGAEDYRALVERWVLPALGGAQRPRAEIRTDAGTMVVELFADEAPLTVASFVRLAESGYFDEQEWPRVVPHFVVQGGDPRGDTSGGPGYALRDEINRHRYRTGSLGMALSGPDTGGSQFFITHSPQPHLDGAYTIFGEVVAGQEVARSILPGDRIHAVRILR